MSVSLGLGLTNDCDLRCAHCYRPPPPPVYLPAEDVRRVCDALDVGGVNLGTGENVLHPRFFEILDDLLARGLPVSLTSNGLSVARLPDETLRRLHDVEVSIDFPDRDRFDAFRGPRAWAAATAALDRCAGLGVPATVLAVLMRDNHRDLPELARLAARWGAPLRVNVFQAVRSERFAPTWAQFWQAIEQLFERTVVLACSEPVIAAAAGLPAPGTACGPKVVRVTPSGEVLPCVYWPEPAGHVDDLCADPGAFLRGPEFRRLSLVPAECAECEWLETCGGGCASRRMLAGGLDRPDPYCPRAHGLPVQLHARVRGGADRLHVQNVCTLLVRWAG